jgi:hypothetical protein
MIQTVSGKPPAGRPRADEGHPLQPDPELLDVAGAINALPAFSRKAQPKAAASRATGA